MPQASWAIASQACLPPPPRLHLAPAPHPLPTHFASRPPRQQLPAPLSRLSCLEDLVLSDNNLQSARLSVRAGQPSVGWW